MGQHIRPSPAPRAGDIAKTRLDRGPRRGASSRTASPAPVEGVATLAAVAVRAKISRYLPCPASLGVADDQAFPCSFPSWHKGADGERRFNAVPRRLLQGKASHLERLSRRRGIRSSTHSQHPRQV